MAFSLFSGIQISLDNITWYSLTDHNRKEIQVNPELIQNEQRMANGTLRKYVVAQKMKISTNWTYVPSKKSLTVDNNYSSAWLDAFYKANVGIPIYVRVNSSEIEPAASKGTIPSETDFTFKASMKNTGLPALQEQTIINQSENDNVTLTGSQTYIAFISDYSSTVVHRTIDCDFVTMNIEFTEI